MGKYSLIFLIFIGYVVNAQYTYTLQPHQECSELITIKHFENSGLNELSKFVFRASSWLENEEQTYQRGFIRFTDLDYILPLVNGVNSAELQLYHSIYETQWSCPADYCNTTFLARITENWDAENLNWYNMPEYTFSSLQQDVAVIEADDCECGEIESCKFFTDATADVTEIIRYWRTHKNSNFGLVFKLVFEAYNNAKTFGSAYSDALDLHPALLLNLDEEIRFVEKEFFINEGDILVLSGSNFDFEYLWDGQIISPYFTITDFGEHTLTVTLPNCTEITNSFTVSPNMDESQYSYPFNVSDSEVVKPFDPKPDKPGNTKPILGLRNYSISVYNGFGTLIHHEISEHLNFEQIANSLSAKGMLVFVAEKQHNNSVVKEKVYRKIYKF